MCLRCWVWLHHNMTPVAEVDFISCSAADPEPFGTGVCFYKHFTRVFGISSMYSRQGCASLSCCKAVQSTICQRSLLNTCYYGPSHSLVSSEALQVKHRVWCTTLHRDLQSHLQAVCSLSPCVVGDPLASRREVLALAHQAHRVTRIGWGCLRASGALAQPHLCLFLQLAQPKQVSCCCVVLHLKASSS